jgi:hypothetical protein
MDRAAISADVKGTPFKHRIAEIHAISMKRISKVEAADDPGDGADDFGIPLKAGGFGRPGEN